jgi:hypothetical protein
MRVSRIVAQICSPPVLLWFTPFASTIAFGDWTGDAGAGTRQAQHQARGSVARPDIEYNCSWPTPPLWLCVLVLLQVSSVTHAPGVSRSFHSDWADTCGHGPDSVMALIPF